MFPTKLAAAMNLPGFSSRERSVLLLLALAGVTGPNGVFLWFALTDYSAIRAALANPVALVFIVEAFVLMFLFAWLIHRSGRQPGWPAFLFMSLIGSLAFSVPAWMWIASLEPKRR